MLIYEDQPVDSLQWSSAHIDMSAILVFALIVTVGAEEFKTMYDDIDVDSILRNHRLLYSYINCLMMRGPCTASGRVLKSEYKLGYDKDIFWHQYYCCNDKILKIATINLAINVCVRLF